MFQHDITDEQQVTRSDAFLIFSTEDKKPLLPSGQEGRIKANHADATCS